MPDARPALLRNGALLVALLAGAAALRFIDLSGLPPAHYRDVALTANDALEAAAGRPRLHYTYDEGLYPNLTALAFLLFGPSDWSVRAVGALCGTLTCLGVWCLGRVLDRERAGLHGAFLMAFSFWHVILSRSGFRAVLLPLLMVFAVALLARGLRGGRTGDFVAGGILFGLGVHVYPAVRFAPFLLPGWLVVEWRSAGRPRRRMAGGLALFAVAAFLAALPMLVDYLRHPEHFTSPHRRVSVFSPLVRASEVPAFLSENLVKTALMFHVRGDLNWRHNLSGGAMLDPLTGLLLVVGLAVLFRDGRRAAAAALVVGWLVAMLLPNVLSVEGVPHGLRSSAVLPALMLLAGGGLAWLEERLARKVGRRIAGAAAGVLLVGLGCLAAHRTFVAWGRSPALWEAHDGPYRAAAYLLLAAPPGTERFVLANGTGYPVKGHPAELQTFLWEMREAPPVILGPGDASRVRMHGRPALVAVLRADERLPDILRDLNPGAAVVAVQGPGLSAKAPVYRISAPAPGGGR